MKDTTPPPENSNISNSESMSDQKKTSITKMSDESREFRELNKEIFQIFQQGGNISNGSNNNNNTNGSVTAVNINDNIWKKTSEPTNKIKYNAVTFIPNPKKFESNKKCDNIDNEYTDIGDEIPNGEEKINQLHIQECKTNNLSQLDQMDAFQFNKATPFIPTNFGGYVPPMMYPKYPNGFYYNNMYLYENVFTISTNQKNNENNDYKRKKKFNFKDKLDQTLFTINLDQIILGRDTRTTIMIRHIPNKYTSQNLLDEIDIACKGKYDFFYLPIDTENNLNLGYSFINFINPLHIIYFYHLFKARKWNLFKSHKECDLTFAKFQGKVELTAHLEKNANKMDDNKKLPMLFEIKTEPQIDMPKEYYDYIKAFRGDIFTCVNFK